MRRSFVTTLVAVAAILIAGAWYWASPYFAIADLRNALIRGDTTAVEERVDFPHLRENIKAQVSTFIMTGMQEQLSNNPFAALGIALAAKFSEVMVESMVTPSGILSLMDLNKGGAKEVSPLALMTSAEVVIRRDGFDAFEVRVAGDQPEHKPAFRFKREGIRWRLVGVQMPKEALEAARNAGGNKRRAAAAPDVPTWRLSENKDPMDDTVTVMLYRDAEEEVRVRFSAVRPTMAFRCRKNGLEAYINFQGMVDYNYETKRAAVRLRFDDGTPSLEGWLVSSDKEALFAPQPKVFLRRLRDSQKLLVQWQQYGGTTSIAKFSRGNLTDHFDRFKNACGVGRL